MHQSVCPVPHTNKLRLLHAVPVPQSFKLASFKGTCSSSKDLELLLQDLPLTHTTHLDMSGPGCQLSHTAAAALTAVTALQDLSLPGHGLAASLAASGAVSNSLSVSLQHLTLSDALQVDAVLRRC